jgi:hypothetical protein
MELSSLKLCIRNYRACIKKLGESKTPQQKNYWSSACQRWDLDIARILASSEKPLQSVQTLIDELTANINTLRKEVNPIICDDILYRFNAIVETLVADTKQVEIAKHGGLSIDRL